MYLPTSLLFANFLLSTTVTSNPTKPNTSASAPVAIVTNGAYYGLLNDHYYMDYFLGIPYAQSPVSDLRYQVPLSVNESWNEPPNATEYGYACIGYGEDSQVAAHNYVNEDCLTLNVYPPTRYRNADDLPVLVWIHGGGFYEGAALDQRYNLTFIVEESVKVNKPIVAVGLNYRLSGWGFLFSEDILEAGVTDLGIRDQRLALDWIQENIAAFGGDPTKVTIWGESAGGASVGIHLLAYNGRNYGLFRRVIAQSGAASGFGYLLAIPLKFVLAIAETVFTDLVQSVGCAGATDKIACLRSLPMETLNDYYNNSAASFLPILDGDIIAR